jgi:hypothetical protein
MVCMSLLLVHLPVFILVCFYGRISRNDGSVAEMATGLGGFMTITASDLVFGSSHPALPVGSTALLHYAPSF